MKATGQVTGEAFEDVVGRISFFVNAGMRFVTEIAKLRAFAICGRKSPATVTA